MELWVASTRATTRGYVVPALERGGWVCTLFDDGAAVMRRLDAEPPDALLLEDPLGTEDAFKVLGRLRLSEARLDLPVVVLTQESLRAQLPATGAPVVPTLLMNVYVIPTTGAGRL